jgi:hypothetical protein
MNVKSTQLAELLEELHEINQQLSEMARPLEQVSDMDFKQRQQLGDQLRGGLARWEDIRQRISQLLAEGSDHAPAKSAP